VSARPDTGHPFGLMRAMIHADGHVVMGANNAEMVVRVDAMADLFAEMGLTAYRLDWLTADAMTTRYVLGLGCARCRPRVSCGCDMVQDVLGGQCPHGTARALYHAATRCGYRDRVPPPVAGGQAELDAYARSIVALDAAARETGTPVTIRVRGKRGRRR
jgi:hypothetical protein